MKKAQELLSKMLFEANNVNNTEGTKAACRECAEYLEQTILVGIKPKLVRVPFSWFYEACCGSCGQPLQTEEECCESCGRKIDWT